MNFRTTVILIVVLAAAALLVVVDRWRGEPAPQPRVTETDRLQGRRLLQIKQADVTRLRITPTDTAHPTIELVRDGEKWKLVQPMQWPGDTWEAGNLVSAVVEMRTRGSVPLSSPEASATGLDKPRFTIELATKDGKQTTLRVGSRSGVGDIYVRLGDSPMGELVGGDLAEKLAKRPEAMVDSLRDKQLLDVQSDRIKQVKIIRGKEPALVLHKIDGNWQIVEPRKMPGDSSEISSLLSSIAYLRASDFVGGAEAKLAQIDRPVLTVWYSTEDPPGATTTAPSTQPAGTAIVFGRYDTALEEKVYARVGDSPALVKISKWTFDSLKKSPLDLRERKVVSIDPAAVNEIRIVTDSPATTRPTTRPARREEIVLRRKPAPATLPAATQATTAPAATQATTAPAATQATTGPATTQAATAPAATQATWPAQPPKPASTWEVVVPKKGDASDGKVQELLEKFNPLRAEKFVESSEATTRPATRYSVILSSVSARYELRITDVEDDKPLVGQYEDLTFELPRSYVEQLTASFVAE